MTGPTWRTTDGRKTGRTARWTDRRRQIRADAKSYTLAEPVSALSLSLCLCRRGPRIIWCLSVRLSGLAGPASVLPPVRPAVAVCFRSCPSACGSSYGRTTRRRLLRTLAAPARTMPTAAGRERMEVGRGKGRRSRPSLRHPADRPRMPRGALPCWR